MRGNTITITMPLKRGKVAKTDKLFQYDYGQKLVFTDVELPPYYEVHFSNEMHGTAVTSLGDSTGVDIPDNLLETGDSIYLWLFLHDEITDGETEFQGVIPVIQRAHVDDQITPHQQTVVEQAIAALQTSIDGAQAAQAGAEAAQAAAEAAQADAETAQNAAEAAQALAEEAAETAQTAATNAYDSAETAQGAVSDAQDAADAAETAQAAAETAQAAAQSASYDAEAWAVGQRDGEDVPSSDPAYHNNAKYYAEHVENVIAEEVDNWLDEHPEATTTVQDGSLTEAKFTAETLEAIKNNYVTPEMFGAKGDGTTDDTSAFNITITYAKTNKCHVFCSAKTYLIEGTVNLQSGVEFIGTRHYLNTTALDFGGTGKLCLNGLHDVTIKGFYFKNFVSAISLESNRNYTIRIEKNKFSDGTTGINVASATGYFYVDDCQFDMTSLTNGVYLYNQTNDNVGINYVYITNSRFDGYGGSTIGTPLTASGINIYVENCDFTNITDAAINCSVAYIGGLFISNTAFWGVGSVIDLTTATVGNYNFVLTACRFHNLTSGVFKNNVANTYTRDVLIEACISNAEILIPAKVYIDALSYNIHGVVKSSQTTNYIESLRGSNIKNCRTTKFGINAGASKTVTIDNKYNYFMSYDAVVFPPDSISIDSISVTDDTVSITVTNNGASNATIFVEIH